MGPTFHSVSHYFLDVLWATFTQLAFLLGPLLLLALIIHFISLYSGSAGSELFGRKTFVILFRWLGVAIHEIGHAVFALLFGHKITKIQLFSPNDKEHEGFVEHQYNRKNIYQNIGMFFIGIGPILFGSFVLFLLTYFILKVNIFSIELIDFTERQWHSFADVKLLVVDLVHHIWKFTLDVLSNGDLEWWRYFLFIYLLYAVGSSISLSVADMKGTLKGFITLTIFLLIFNVLTVWISNFTLIVFQQVGRYLIWLYFLLMLNIFINFVMMILLVATSEIIKRKAAK